jgi:hypothetical protein
MSADQATACMGLGGVIDQRWAHWTTSPDEQIQQWGVLTCERQ